MRVLITIPSTLEFDFLQKNVICHASTKMSYLVTGIGIPSTILSLMSKSMTQYDLILQAGIAGGVNDNLQLGDVCIVQNEYWGDLGVWQGDSFLSIKDLGLQNEKELSNTNSSLTNPTAIEWMGKLDLPLVNGVTVNQITTCPKMINHFKSQNRAVESMEGAAFHLCCLHHQIPFLQIRSLSNRVGERNKKNWQIEKAMYALADHLNKLLLKVKHI